MLFIFDVDGTLIFQTPPGGPWADPRYPERNTFMPRVQEICRGLVEDGNIVALASNQGGVAHGFLTYEQADAKMRFVAEGVGAQFYEFCPYSPDGTIPEWTRSDNCRKPNPGMITSLQTRTGVPWDEIVFVGNEITDWQAALMAGVRFVWANDFF